MKKIKIQKGCLWLNGQLFKIGDILEADDKTADKLVADGIAGYFMPASDEVAKIFGVSQGVKNDKSTEKKEELTTLPPPDFAGKQK